MKNKTMTRFWKILFVIAVFIFIGQNGWGQTTIVQWTFEDQNAAADAGIAGNLSQTITSATGTPVYSVTGSGGTGTYCASNTGWDAGNGIKYWEINFLTTGYTNLKISSKQRSSDTGPRDFKIQYKIGAGGTYTDLPGAAIVVANDNFVSGVVLNISLPFECDNQASVYLRWIMTSDISVVGGVIGTVGTSRIDDILITGYPASFWTGASSTDWNTAENWSANSEPASSVEVVIPSAPLNQPHVTAAAATPATCGALTINNGATLTIDALKVLTTSGATTNNGTFTIKSDANGTGSFIDNGTFAGSGTYNVEKYLEGSGTPPSGKFWYIGSPVSSAASDVFDAAGNNKLWSHSEITGLYTEITEDVTPLNVMKGYAARLGANSTITFAGSLNTGTIGSLDNLTRTASSAFEGYNLVCNPYPSAVLFDVTGTGLTRTNLETTIWYRSNSLFPTYNFSNGAAANGGQANIPAMQAFWVKVAYPNTTGTLIMGNTARQHSAVSFYKETSESNVFRMEVSNGTLNDETVVGFYQGAADIFENNDSRKMFSDDNNYPQIYTLTSDNIIVIINGLPELAANEERIIPLGFLTNVSGSFTLDATNMGEFDSNIPVYLEDVQQNVIQDLHQSDTYAFTSSVVNDANRFKLHFGNMVASIPTISESSASIYAANNNIYVNTPKTAAIEVYDVPGKLIMNQQSAQGLNKLQLDVETGIYIVKVQTGTQITTKKVMISK